MPLLPERESSERGNEDLLVKLTRGLLYFGSTSIQHCRRCCGEHSMGGRDSQDWVGNTRVWLLTRTTERATNFYFGTNLRCLPAHLSPVSSPIFCSAFQRFGSAS